MRLRRLLNVESGLNDGLALPVVLALIGTMDGLRALRGLATSAVGGVVLGAVLAWGVVRIAKTRLFVATTSYVPLGTFAIGLLLFALARMLGANEFLAAFAGGITAASIHPQLAKAFQTFGDQLANLLKFAGLFVFGMLISPATLAALEWRVYAFAVLALLIVRPVALSVALVGSRMPWREWAAAAWFGPKGFASVLYAILVLKAGFGDALHFFHVAAVVIALSMIARSSTDVLTARWLLHAHRASATTGASTPHVPRAPPSAAAAEENGPRPARRVAEPALHAAGSCGARVVRLDCMEGRRRWPPRTGATRRPGVNNRRRYGASGKW